MKKIFRRLQHNTEGGIATYVLIMFGVIFIMYLFGFYSLWEDYEKANDLNTTSDSSFATGVFNTLSKSLNIETVATGIGALVVGMLLIRFVAGGQAAATVLTYAIPLAILLVLNIFIFPLSSNDVDVSFMGITGTVFLFAFFNLFFILSVIEFVRGSA